MTLQCFVTVALCLAVTAGKHVNLPKIDHVCNTTAPNEEGDIIFQLMFCSEVYGGKDSNGDSKVTLKEYMGDSAEIPTERSKALFCLLDTNGDSVIDRTDDTEHFHRMDEDHDGTISFDEYGKVYGIHRILIPMTALFERIKLKHKVDALSKAQFGDLFSSLHVENDGSITKTTLKTGFNDPPFEMIAPEIALIATDMFDTDHDNVISKAEVSSQFDGLDKNGDQALTYLEFIDVALQKAGKRIDEEMAKEDEI